MASTIIKSKTIALLAEEYNEEQLIAALYQIAQVANAWAPNNYE
jgi:hypothetical protein